MKKTFIRLTALLCCSGVLYAEETDVHLVRRGETFSQIAKKHLGRPIYKAASGSIARLWKLNPHVNDPNRIRIGEKIFLRERERELASEDTSPAGIEPDPPPTPTVNEDATPIEKRFSVLELSPTLYYSTLEGTLPSTGSRATLTSKLNTGVSLAWRQHWSESFETFANAGLKQEKYAANASTSSEIQGANQTLTNLGVGAKWRFTKKIWLAGEFGYSQELYYRGLSTGSGIELESVPVPKAALTLGARIAEIDPFYIDVKASGIYTGAASAALYEAKAGSGYRGEIDLGQNFENLKAGVSLFYENRKQDSSIVEIRRKEVGLGVFFVWRLGR